MLKRKHDFVIDLTDYLSELIRLSFKSSPHCTDKKVSISVGFDDKPLNKFVKLTEKYVKSLHKLESQLNS